MWIPPFLATPEAVKKQALQHNSELYVAGRTCVELQKLAGTPQSVYSLAGRLIGSKSGWLLLEVPNALVRGAFDALHEPGAELPPDLDAHISVMRPEELEQLGGLDKITERGHMFRYQLGPIQTVNPQGWPEYSKCWFIRVRSSELEKLRKSYGLTAKPKDNEHDFHITVAVRKTTVLQPNEVSKAALDLTHEIASDTGTNSPIPAVRQEAKKPRVRVFMPTNSHFLLQRAITNPQAYRVPGGGVEPGESHMQALQREIHEEFGKTPPKDELKYLGADPRKPFPHEYYYLWKQHGLHPGTYQASNDDQEIIELAKRRAQGPNYWGPPVQHFGLHKHGNWMDDIQPDGTIKAPSGEKVIYIVRHGKTQMNNTDPDKDKIRGWKDVPLSEEGKTEAKRLGTILKDTKLTHIFSSNLSRTEDTAKEIGKHHKCKILCGEAIRPWNVGEYTGQISAKVHPILAEHAKSTPDEVLKGGESFNQFKERYLGFLESCMAMVEDGKAGPIAIVAHFRNCKMTQAWVKENCNPGFEINEEVFLRNDLPTGAVLKLSRGGTKGWVCSLEAAAGEGGEAKGHGKASADSTGFISGPSVAPDTNEDDTEQPITDRPDDIEGTVAPEAVPAENSPKGMGRGTTKWAGEVLVKAIAGRYGLIDEPVIKEAGEYIGHHKPAERVKRETFGYLPPKGNVDEFAQCSTCRAWTGEKHNTCMILGKEPAYAHSSCNYYQHGKPNPDGAGKEVKVLTPKQAGLVHRQVRCENCAFADKDDPAHPYCELYEHLNEKWPKVFDLDKNIEPKACCNFQTPSGGDVEEEAKKAALWYLEDELSKEKEASANRISLTVINPEKEKVAADLKDTLGRLAVGTVGAGSLALGGAMLYQGWNKPGQSWLEQGHQLWKEPANHERLGQALGDPELTKNMISMAAERPALFRNLLAGHQVPDVDPAIQRQVRDVTFGQNKQHMKSEPGDLMVSGTRKGFLGAVQPWATGSSAMHTDVGGLRGGNWLGLWTWYADHPKNTHALTRNNPSLRVAPWDVPPADRYRIGLRPRDKFLKNIDKQEFREFLTKEKHPFSEQRFTELALNEVLPELSTGTGHRLGPIGRWLAGSPKIKRIFASSTMPQSYNKLLEQGYTPDQAAEVCSSFAAQAVKKFSPRLIPGKHQEYSPAGIARLAEPGGPYQIHQIELPKKLMLPEELEAEHRRIKWGPLLWRLPIAAGLLGGGGYLAHQALKSASDHRHDLACVKVKRRDREVLICPHCGKEVEDKDLYTDKKGWVFHRPCFAKGKGSIKLGAFPVSVAQRLRVIAEQLDKRAFSGGLGSDPVSGIPATDPPKPTRRDGSTDAAKLTHAGSLFDTMAGTSETQEPLDDVGISYRTATPVPVDASTLDLSASPATDLPTSSVGAQGHIFTSASPGAGQEYGYPSGEAGMSAPAAGKANSEDESETDDLGEVKVDPRSSTAAYGQVPHLFGPGGFAP